MPATATAYRDTSGDCPQDMPQRDMSGDCPPPWPQRPCSSETRLGTVPRHVSVRHVRRGGLRASSGGSQRPLRRRADPCCINQAKETDDTSHLTQTRNRLGARRRGSRRDRPLDRRCRAGGRGVDPRARPAGDVRLAGLQGLALPRPDRRVRAHRGGARPHQRPASVARSDAAPARGDGRVRHIAHRRDPRRCGRHRQLDGDARPRVALRRRLARRARRRRRSTPARPPGNPAPALARAWSQAVAR